VLSNKLSNFRSRLSNDDIGRVIEMAWEDRTPFEVIETEYGLDESEVIDLMRSEMKKRSFTMWRKRVTGRKTKHRALRGFDVGRHRCPSQRTR
jgi:uncharacterized protein (TIGR03643 family)